MAERTYYWLKMPKGFMDKHYMKMIRGKEPNGIELSLFYIWMLTESVDHGAKLRYSEKTPYDAELLSEASGFSEELVEEGLQFFEKRELIEIAEDGTIFMIKGNEMIGSETSAAARMRNYRKRNNVQDSSDMSQNCYEHIEKDIDIEIDIEKENTKESQSASVVDYEKAWGNTFDKYPKKTSPVKAKSTWMDKLLDVIDSNRPDVATLIYQATILYIKDYTEKNPDDESYRYIPKYSDWLNDECDYWIKEIEKKQKESSE